jgi:hypothetical protein
MAVKSVEAVVFDLFYTLVHPGEFPEGGSRSVWLGGLLGIDPGQLDSRWNSFEPLLESGQAPAVPPLGPELSWIMRLASELGTPIETEALTVVERDWDFLTARRLFIHARRQ